MSKAGVAALAAPAAPAAPSSSQQRPKPLTAVFCVVGIVLAAGVGVALWQLVLWVQKQQKGHHHHPSHGSGGSDGPYIPGDYHPPAPGGLTVTPFSDTALQLQFTSVPTLLVTQYYVASIQVPGSGKTPCPTTWPTGPLASLQTVPQVYTKPGDSQPVSTVITGLLPNTAYCTYVQSLGELHGGQYVGTPSSVATATPGPPGPPAPSDTVTLSITYQPPGPAPFYMPPVLMATLSPVQDPTPYTLTWYCNEEMTASGSFAQKQQNLVVTDGDWYATVTCEGPTCPLTPIAPSNTITVKLPSS